MITVDLCAHCGAVCGPEGCPEHGLDRVIRNVPRHNALAIMLDMMLRNLDLYQKDPVSGRGVAE